MRYKKGTNLIVEQLTDIVNIARNCGAYLYSDEMYRGLIIDRNCKPLPPVFELYERGISLWGMAKSFTLAGLRIGWIATRDSSLVEAILTFKDHLSMYCSAPYLRIGFGRENFREILEILIKHS